MKILQKDIINESLLLDKLPDDVLEAIVSNKTSLGNNPAIPDIFDVPFLMKLANERFSDIKNALEEIGSIDDVESKDLKSALSELIEKCKEIEKPYRSELEKVCVNTVIDLFSVPDDMIDLHLELTDDVVLDGDVFLLDPCEDDDDFEFDDVDDAMNIKSEVMKRRILDALCMGASILISSDIELYEKEISSINPQLCDLYKKIISLNNYLLYTKNDIGMTDTKKMQIGTVQVMLGQQNEKPRLYSQGILFPMLLSETLRGFFELFISHGLPKDVKTAKMVLKKSDYLKAEPWDMRLGPSLWNLFSHSLNDTTYNEIPYLMKRVSCLEPSKFNFLMKEVFAKTRKGRGIMSKICGKAKEDIEYDNFTDRMDKLKADKSVITDEYISADEL